MSSTVPQSGRDLARFTLPVKRKVYAYDMPLLDLSELRVIVIDDNEFATILMRRLLGVMRVAHVATCSDALEADAAIRQSKADLVIVDIDMPGRNGIEVVHDIRHGQVGIAKDVCILVASAHVDIEHVEQARSEGANWIVAKPLSFRTLYDGVARAILDDRPFIDSSSYVGPCRRTKAVPLADPDSDRRKRPDAAK
jgi:two-component system, chemotaxis family, chemotaxis protein CheY